MMKWEDLEPGDVVKVTKIFALHFPGATWTNRNLVINKISAYDHFGQNFIDVYCEGGAYHFQINEDGCCRHHEDLGLLFEIIELSNKC